MSFSGLKKGGNLKKAHNKYPMPKKQKKRACADKEKMEKEIIREVEKEFTKQYNKKTIISALIISAILFSSGVYVGFLLNREKLSGIEVNIDKVSSEMENFQLQFLFFDILGETATCPLLRNTLKEINEESYNIGTKLDQYASDNELKDMKEYEKLKKEYSRIIISYWLLSNKLKGACGLDAATIIFFIGKDCAECDQQAFVLTYLKEKFGDKILIFTLDGSMEEPSIEVLKNYYNVTDYPAIVVNGKRFDGLTKADTILERINETGNAFLAYDSF